MKDMFMVVGIMAVVIVLFEGARTIVLAFWSKQPVQNLKIRFALSRLAKRGVASRRELARAMGELSPRSCGAKARTLNKITQFGVRWQSTGNPERVRLLSA